MPWNPILSIGVEKIDKQHEALFQKAEALFEAGKNGKSKEYIGELLSFLGEYTVTHFRDEEAYMAAIDYPGLSEQKQQHKGFIDHFTALKGEYERSGGKILLILNANKFIIDWLTQHISVEDKKIGEFAKQAGK
ncbi:MAG TPA: bacteriohemerythrin [Clostridia bacterium]|nr:bacteriohemerythrin [Clostridia bacterium]